MSQNKRPKCTAIYSVVSPSAFTEVLGQEIVEVHHMLFLEVYMIGDVLHDLGDQLEPSATPLHWFLVHYTMLIWRHCFE